MLAGRVYADPRAAVYVGDAVKRMAQLPADSVDCIVTSPPYFGLRDYGHEGQLGAESSLEEYVAGLVRVFDEAWRVLKPAGTLWLNLGDSYARTGGGGNGSSDGEVGRNGGHRKAPRSAGCEPSPGGADSETSARPRPATRAPAGIREKSLLGVPWRVALALQDRGWILRADVIWAKPNPMPESVRDRPTKAHEYVFMLTKSPRYYYDAAAVAEPVAPATIARLVGQDVEAQEGKALKPPRMGGSKYGDDDEAESRTKSGNDYTSGNSMRNRRTVWTIPPRGYKGAHFAVMPAELARVCIRASTPADGIVLDMFAGSGTVAEIALQEGKRTIAVELNADYLPLILERLAKGERGRPAL
jgi:DNA modification methylase